ncbi:hypothetical protein DUNSADRAFT_7426 [Dunaliella salina]|uniref:Encoded protein n=1 Tax=Dunaliella salina TaxID=3046 RepID=A0ABQ7GLM7_DUNSA|nr:hypothetical protein DUNSADRAFT_7426 [Dunaliella salina]|eukprot:KAF5835438.1 hypothetical protein DUNSADRAFT_7426 [Dunaliella salina]
MSGAEKQQRLTAVSGRGRHGAGHLCLQSGSKKGLQGGHEGSHESKCLTARLCPGSEGEKLEGEMPKGEKSKGEISGGSKSEERRSGGVEKELCVYGGRDAGPGRAQQLTSNAQQEGGRRLFACVCLVPGSEERPGGAMLPGSDERASGAVFPGGEEPAGGTAWISSSLIAQKETGGHSGTSVPANKVSFSEGNWVERHLGDGDAARNAHLQPLQQQEPRGVDCGQQNCEQQRLVMAAHGLGKFVVSALRLL